MLSPARFCTTKTQSRLAAIARLSTRHPRSKLPVAHLVEFLAAGLAEFAQ